MQSRCSPHVTFKIKNRDGDIRCEFYRADSDKAVIYMHGVGGGTHGPSNIYHPLAEDLQESGISSLLIDCRYDSNLIACISDVLACIDYLDKNYHIDKIGLIGWSFGGAVVIAAAVADQRVKTLITVASQSVWHERRRPHCAPAHPADPWYGRQNAEL